MSSWVSVCLCIYIITVLCAHKNFVFVSRPSTLTAIFLLSLIFRTKRCMNWATCTVNIGQCDCSGNFFLSLLRKLGVSFGQWQIVIIQIIVAKRTKMDQIPAPFLLKCCRFCHTIHMQTLKLYRQSKVDVSIYIV